MLTRVGLRAAAAGKDGPKSFYTKVHSIYLYIYMCVYDICTLRDKSSAPVWRGRLARKKEPLLARREDDGGQRASVDIRSDGRRRRTCGRRTRESPAADGGSCGVQGVQDIRFDNKRNSYLQLARTTVDKERRPDVKFNDKNEKKLWGDSCRTHARARSCRYLENMLLLLLSSSHIDCTRQPYVANHNFFF